MSKRCHNFGTKRFKEKSLFIFHARIALKSLILLFVRLIARGARIGKTHRHTDRKSTVTLAHARRGLNILLFLDQYDTNILELTAYLTWTSPCLYRFFCHNSETCYIAGSYSSDTHIPRHHYQQYMEHQSPALLVLLTLGAHAQRGLQ